MAMTSYLYGKPKTVDFDAGATAYAAGDVVVIGGLPCVCHEAIPAFTGGQTRDGLAVGGGVYQMTADAAYPPGTQVHWDPTQSKVTTKGGGNTVSFGFVVGGANQRLDDAASTDCIVLHEPSGGPVAVYSQTAASTAVSNTTTETLFDKSATVPANTLQPGDVVRVRAQVIATSTNSTDTLNVKLYVGGLTGTAVASTGALDVANNDIAYVDVDIVVRTNGASGTIVAAGITNIGTPGTATCRAANLASTAIDTTAAQAIGLSATWSVANAGNSCRLDLLDVQIVRK